MVCLIHGPFSAQRRKENMKEKFCGECGARLDEATGLCPKCDAEKLRRWNEWLDQPKWKEPAEAPKQRERAPAGRREEKKRSGTGKRTQKSVGKEVWTFVLKFCVSICLLLALVIIAQHLLRVHFSRAYFTDDFNTDSLIQEMAELPEFVSDLPNLISENNAHSDEGNYDIQVTLQNFKGNCYEILAAEKKSVLFTVEPSSKVPDNTIVVETAEGTMLGYMNDNGENGDLQANDGIYSCSTLLSSDVVGSVAYRASYYKATSNSFSIVFYTEITSEEYKGFQEIYTKVSSCYSASDIETILQSESIIDEYTVGNDSVTFRTTFGMTGIYEWNCSQKVKGTGQYAVSTTSGVDYAQASDNLSYLDFDVARYMEGANIIALRPFRTSQFTYEDFKYAGMVLSSFTGGELDCIDDANVTLETMKSLKDYKIALIDSHGTLSNVTNSAWDILDTDPYILTGEEYTAFGMWTSADWQAGRIVVCGTDIFWGKGYVAVGAKFFDRYYNDGDLNGSVFFLGTCYSMKNASIADTLIRKGAEVVYGYSNPVYTSYCNRTLFETMINSMLLSGMSAGEAFDEARNIYGSIDPNNSDCSYLMSGNSEFTIISQQHKVTSGERDIVLVLDVSGSMAGSPMEETKKASVKFIDTILDEDASIGIVTYDDSASMQADFSADKAALEATVSGIYDGGSTNIEAGLAEAEAMLRTSGARKKIIVLMSDGEPNAGKEGDELIAYADSLKEKGIIIYTLGFFESLGGYKSSAQTLMEGIASDGCHYEVASADDLVFFFEDMADQINGQKYIYIRIACPVDVTVAYNGEILSSEEDRLNVRTEFGTLTFEEREDGSSADAEDRIKVLRLKEGAEYDVRINGTGRGLMDYTIGFMDENGEYSDFRRFEKVKITRKTKIDTVAAVSETSVLNIDEDGDGRYDLKLRAEENGYGEEVDNSLLIYAAIGGGALLLVVVLVLVVRGNRKKRKTER